MTKPTPEEIAAEIAALEALEPKGPHASALRDSIEIHVGVLKGEIDNTAEEFNEMTQQQQDAASEAFMWRDGDSIHRPSASYEGAW